jgi:hypothetical protein
MDGQICPGKRTDAFALSNDSSTNQFPLCGKETLLMFGIENGFVRCVFKTSKAAIVIEPACARRQVALQLVLGSSAQAVCAEAVVATFAWVRNGQLDAVDRLPKWSHPSTVPGYIYTWLSLHLVRICCHLRMESIIDDHLLLGT